MTFFSSRKFQVIIASDITSPPVPLISLSRTPLRRMLESAHQASIHIVFSYFNFFCLCASLGEFLRQPPHSLILFFTESVSVWLLYCC